MKSISVDPVVIYRALGDETRLSMVKKVASCNGPVASCSVVASCPCISNLTQPTVSHHFAKLVSSGVLVEKKIGTQKMYTVDKRLLEASGFDVERLLQ